MELFTQYSRVGEGYGNFTGENVLVYSLFNIIIIIGKIYNNFDVKYCIDNQFITNVC